MMRGGCVFDKFIGVFAGNTKTDLCVQTGSNTDWKLNVHTCFALIGFRDTGGEAGCGEGGNDV